MVHNEAISRLRETALEVTHGAAFRLRRWVHRANLPTVTADDREILDALELDGACASTLEALGVPESAALLRDADRLMTEMTKQSSRPGGGKDYVVTASPALIADYPAILRWGLDERLLAIAESYIGMPVTYRGVLARLDFPDGSVKETRLWHLDQEDTRILKIVVYVNDVSDSGGPFEYIPASLKQPRNLAEGPKLRINDADELAESVPPKHWRAVTGRRGTTAFVDTCRIFHRGRLPTAGARQSLFFAYNSRWPMRPTHCNPLFEVERFVADNGPLAAHQKAALDFSYVR